jgi:hypothetical protein
MLATFDVVGSPSASMTLTVATAATRTRKKKTLAATEVVPLDRTFLI